MPRPRTVPDGGRRTVLIVAGVVQFTLFGAALVDLARRSPAEVKGPRWAWTMASFVNVVGPVAYFVLGRRRTRRP